MRRALLGAALVALVAALLSAPPAHAALADGLLPVVTPADGVRFVTLPRNGMQVRFGPSARPLYRRELAGREVRVQCTETRIEGPSALMRSDRSTSETVRAPRRMGRLSATAEAVAEDADLCTLATPDEIGGLTCDEGWCAVAIAALTPAGAERVEELQRALDLSLALLGVVLAAEGEAWPSARDVRRELDDSRVGAPDDPRADWTVLASADDAPAVAGPVGYFSAGRTMVLSARTAGGRRLFVRFDGDVFSTNVPDLVGGVG